MLAKKCKHCLILKNISDFTPSSDGYLGAIALCRPCHKNYLSEQRRKRRKPIVFLENEIWKDVIGYEGLYKVSNLGRVHTLDRYTYSEQCGGLSFHAAKILSQSSHNGYKHVILTKRQEPKTFNVHKLVLLSFNKEKLIGQTQANHINSIKDDNRLENLEWVTPRENTCHAILNEKLKKKYSCIGSYYHAKNKKWVSRYVLDGKDIYLGSFDTEQEAHQAYVSALNKHGITNRYMVSK